MRPFSYAAPRDIRSAHRLIGSEAMFIAGGTDMLQLLQEDVIAPARLIDISGLPFRGIDVHPEGAIIGAMAHLSDVADDSRIRTGWPALAQALTETASAQVRNMATAGGNLLQRTRCLYFRDGAAPCNKREPGSGCGAWDGQNRMNAVLGGSRQCIAAYPGDMAVALTALDADLVLHGPDGERRIKISELYREPGGTPHVDTTLRRGEIITAITLAADRLAGRSCFVKVRDRATFEWALASAAVAMELHDGRVSAVRIVAGGVAARPWRLPRVEQRLTGQVLGLETARRASQLAAKGAEPRPGNAFKVPLVCRVVERAVLRAGGLA